MEELLQHEYVRYLLLIGVTLLVYHLITKKKNPENGEAIKEIGASIVDRAKSIFEKIKDWFALWPDAWAIPMALVGLYASYYVIAWLDPTAGKFDIGIMQAIIIGSVTIVVINTLAFLGIEFNFPVFWNYYKKQIKEDFLNLSPCVRLLAFLALYAFLFTSILVVIVSLL
jgi:hypothetical protein